MKESIQKLADFAADNYIILAAAAGVILLIVIVAAIAGRSRKSREAGREKDFFLEGEYDALLKEAAAERRKGQQEPQAEAEAETETEEPQVCAETESSGEIVEETVDEISGECSEEICEEELQPVHININIGRGQVLLGYEEDGQIRCTVKAEQEDAEEFQALEEELAAYEPAEEPAPPAEEPAAPQGIILEKISIVRQTPVKKFGPDNFNTGRSGRVFTEEELIKQIKE